MPGLAELASFAAESARQANVLQDTTSAAYWAYHAIRSAFFATQGLASLLLTSARNGDLLRGKVQGIEGPLDADGVAKLAQVRL